jgi:predicted aspartyl protease
VRADVGVTFVEGEVQGPAGTREVKFLVDSGATYTLLSDGDWRAIGLEPKRAATFTLADGTELERQVSECRLVLPQGDCHTPVILGESGDEPLLGMVTLEILGLVLDPFRRELKPMRMLLA